MIKINGLVQALITFALCAATSPRRASAASVRLPAPSGRTVAEKETPFVFPLPKPTPIPLDDGKTKPTPIPREVPHVVMQPVSKGHYSRLAPDPDGLYRLPPGSWYCCAIDWSTTASTPARAVAIDVAEVARAFADTRKWGAMFLWSHPDRLDSGGGATLPKTIPITRELEPGRIWIHGFVVDAATLTHERAIEVWKRWTGDV